jgi:hypothetical protein
MSSVAALRIECNRQEIPFTVGSSFRVILRKRPVSLPQGRAPEGALATQNGERARCVTDSYENVITNRTIGTAFNVRETLAATDEVLLTMNGRTMTRKNALDGSWWSWWGDGERESAPGRKREGTRRVNRQPLLNGLSEFSCHQSQLYA